MEALIIFLLSSLFGWRIIVGLLGEISVEIKSDKFVHITIMRNKPWSYILKVKTEKYVLAKTKSSYYDPYWINNSTGVELDSDSRIVIAINRKITLINAKNNLNNKR